MSQISLPALAKIAGVSRRNLQRMAADDLIPGASRTAGGHWRVKNDAALAGWISARSFEKMERNTLGREKAAPLFNACVKFEKRLKIAELLALDPPSGGNIHTIMRMKDYLTATRKQADEAIAKFDAYLDFAYRMFSARNSSGGDGGNL